MPLITNVMGSSAEEFSALVGACDERAEIAAIELNVSCPNVETGLDIGADPQQLEQVVGACRASTRKPLIVEAHAEHRQRARVRARGAGGRRRRRLADQHAARDGARAAARGPARDGRGRPWLGGGTGGLSGPAIRAVALAQVAAVAERVSIPVVGMGGVQRAAHARDLLDAGATLVAVGTETFRDPGGRAPDRR